MGEIRKRSEYFSCLADELIQTEPELAYIV